MNEAMLDLETLGTGPDSAIMSIGACVFDRFSYVQDPADAFYVVVNRQSNAAFGRVEDEDTVAWWSRQSEQARAIFSAEQQATAVPLNEALAQFAAWLRSNDVLKVWAKSPDFDCTIVHRAFQACRLPWPIKFWNYRCVRTAEAMVGGVRLPRAGTYHNALDDALYQAVCVQQAFNKVRANG